MGTATEFDQTKPIKISGFAEKISRISAGGLHSLALTVTGKLYSWGNNISGQLGFGAGSKRLIQNKQENSPREVTNLVCPITDIAAGRYFSLLLNEDGEVLTSGSNDNGQLGKIGYGGIAGEISFVKSLELGKRLFILELEIIIV